MKSCDVVNHRTEVIVTRNRRQEWDERDLVERISYLDTEFLESSKIKQY